MSIVVENISKYFDEIKVFEKLSFESDNGKILCIEGKSGEGKTTLLRCLNKLEQVDEGKIFIDGENILEIKDAKKNRILDWACVSKLQSFPTPISSREFNYYTKLFKDIE